MPKWQTSGSLARNLLGSKKAYTNPSLKAPQKVDFFGDPAREGLLRLEIEINSIMKKEVSTKKLVETIIEGIQNRKGQRIVTVDLRKLAVAPAEYFIIAEGGSNTQVAAIADEVDSFVRTQTHVHPLFVDGRDNAEWIVLDYGNIFVHIMQREPRAYYDIEHLWADGKITEIPEV